MAQVAVSDGKLQKAAWEKIKSIVSAALNVIKKVIESVWKAIINFLTPILNTIRATFSSVWSTIQSVVTSVVNTIRSVIQTVWNAIGAFFTSIFTAIGQSFTTAWSAISVTVSTTFTTIKTKVTEIWNAIKLTISTVLTAIGTTVTNAWAGMKSTIALINAGSVALFSSAASVMGLYDLDNEHWIVNHTPNGVTKLPRLGSSATANGTVGSSFSDASFKQCNLMKIGNIVFMQMNLSYSTTGNTIATNTTLFTIPAAYRPSSNTVVPAACFRWNSLMPYAGMIKINSDGTIVQAQTQNMTGIYCFAMWEVS